MGSTEGDIQGDPYIAMEAEMKIGEQREQERGDKGGCGERTQSRHTISLYADVFMELVTMNNEHSLI